jgi:HKD family nuclease
LSTFITNHENKDLKRRLQELIEISGELKFLVGFFYFSGIKEFYETLIKLYEEGKLLQEHIKILVGLNVDKGNYGLYEVSTEFKDKNKDKYIQALINSVKTAFTSQELDTEEIYQQVEFFIKLLEEKIIVIKKTKEPNHSKLYLFKTNEKSAPHLFITGSSNLTRAGIISQIEFNVEIKDYGFKEAEKYFDDLWKNAISLSEDDVRKLIHTIENETALRKITPFLAYVYLLKTYIDTHKTKDISKDLIDLMKRKDYKPYSYQMEAVSQAIANCESHGGTILADVVGLGKTVVACMVAKALGKRGIVIAPPHLIGTEDKSIGWKKYLEDFELYGWETFSVGKLEKALEFVKDHDNIEVVIVDEAHRFRNENTLSYHYLNEICRGKTILLLTATPFNNRPSDIYALLKLFTIPKKSTIVFDEDLKSKFIEYENLFTKLSYIKNYHNAPNKKKGKSFKLLQKNFWYK